MHIADKGHAERHPPNGRDQKRDLHPDVHRDAHAGPCQHHDQAQDERHARADIAPGVTLRRHLVVTLVGGGIHEERIVEHHRAVQHDGRDDVDHEESQRSRRDAQRRQGDGARAHGSDEELLLVALEVGQAAQNRHEQRQQKRRHRLGIAPRHHNRRTRFCQRLEIHGDQRRRKQHEGRIAHIVEDPAFLLLGQLACHGLASRLVCVNLGFLLHKCETEG